jgi:hypothetical protein
VKNAIGGGSGMRSLVSRCRGLGIGICLAVSACQGSGGSHHPAPRPTRFTIEVSDTVSQPVYVLLKRSDNQSGWVTVARQGVRLFLEERCDIPDCGALSAVCGATPAQIIALGRREVMTYEWDGMISTIDSTAGCEKRVPAAPGVLTARFCFSLKATNEDGSLPRARAFPGRLVAPTCSDQSFVLNDAEVRFRF